MDAGWVDALLPGGAGGRHCWQHAMAAACKAGTAAAAGKASAAGPAHQLLALQQLQVPVRECLHSRHSRRIRHGRRGCSARRMQRRPTGRAARCCAAQAAAGVLHWPQRCASLAPGPAPHLGCEHLVRARLRGPERRPPAERRCTRASRPRQSGSSSSSSSSSAPRMRSAAAHPGRPQQSTAQRSATQRGAGGPPAQRTSG